MINSINLTGLCCTYVLYRAYCDVLVIGIISPLLSVVV
jgi:hypothetical protein